MTARANYVISAEDATKDAIRSIQSNFKSLDRGIQSTARGVNLTLGFLAGAGLKSLFRNSLEATAEATGATSEFSKTLEDVKKSAQSLMVPKQGLPGVTANLKELAETLKDPAVVSAADALFSAILRGGTAAVNVLAQTAAGLRILATGKGGNAAVDIDTQLREKLGRADLFRNDTSDGGRKRYREAILEVEGLRLKYAEALRGDSGKGLQSVTGGGEALSNILDLVDKQSKGLVAAQEAAVEYNDTIKELAETSKKLPEMTGSAIEETFKDTDPYRLQTEALEAQQKLNEDAAKSLHDMEVRTNEWRDKMTEENKRAAKESTDAWADMFFDVMSGNFDDLLHKWKRTLKMMVAESAASGLLSFLKGGSFLGGFNSGISSAGSSLAHLLGFANGGSILPGGSGSTDSQVVAFRKSPSERVDIYTPGKQGGGMVFAPVYNIDNRGATVDAIQALPAILSRNNKALEAHIVTGLRNGRYDQ